MFMLSAAHLFALKLPVTWPAVPEKVRSKVPE